MTAPFSGEQLATARRAHKRIQWLALEFNLSYMEAALLGVSLSEASAEYLQSLERTKRFMERFDTWMDRQDIDRETGR